MSVTIDDVVARCGLSKATVSRAFSQPHLLRHQTRERVLATAKEIGYSPNLIARAMVRKTTETIGFILSESQNPALLNPFYAPILHTILQRTTQLGYSLMIASSADLRQENGQIAWKQPLDGVILAGQVHQDLVAFLEARNIPIVALNNQDHKQLVSVTNLDYDGTQAAIQALLDAGKTRIGFVGGDFSQMVIEQRKAAYISVMQNAGQAVEEVWMTQLSPTVEAARAWLDQQIHQRGRETLPEAFFCANDILAVGILKALLRNGITVPQEVSVIGFDDSPIASMVEPELSTVQVQKEEMGRLAIDLLMQLMRGEEPEKRHWILPVYLIRRGSSV